LKDGDGREALDHFSKCDVEPVEPKLLAAAFSLIGDEARALPLWELAYQQSQDATVLHEWAGALIRSSRSEQARALKGVDLAAAYACAARVFFVRGDFWNAVKVGEEALLVQPNSRMAYDTACAYARAGDASSALRLLKLAGELGFRDASYAETDSDLATLHGMPGFAEWLSELRKSRAS
jgi:hypothetical protein